MLKTKNDTSLNRYLAMVSLLVITFAILTIKFLQIQVTQHKQYEKRANINSIRAESLHAPRGSILDMNGKIIVDNAPTYLLNARPNVIGDIDSVITVISQLINVDSTLLLKNYYKNYIGYFSPVRLAKDLTFEQILLLEEHKLDLPGIDYKYVQERNYPNELIGSHFLGYVMEVDRDNLERIASSDEYKPGDFIGRQGLEKSYEEHLREQRGIEYKAIDTYGRIIDDMAGKNNIPPSPGKDLITTVDSELQILVETLMKNKRGVAIVGDPLTGGILSFVSSPSYPSDLFTGETSREEWNRIVNDPGKPLLNRITGGLYPPGSTLKMIVLTYLLETNTINPNKQYYCSGKYQFGNRSFGCWDENGHGYVNLDKSLIQSCDVYFYNVIQSIPLDEWADHCKKFGFGKKTGIDLPSESRGNVPNTEYYNSRFGKRGWTNGNKLNLAIGQGETLVTPLQLFSFINLLFSHGHTKQPNFSNSEEASEIIIDNFKNLTWERINYLLLQVVNSNKGTGKLANPHIDGLQVAGKTGTAENSHGDPHAWFIGYATKDNINCSFVILLENAGHGGDEAAPIARDILSFIFAESEQVEKKSDELES